MTDKNKTTDAPDLNKLAIEACDMWQEHLSNLANDPAARAELTRFLEPQRRLFADWAQMMQQGLKSGGSPDVTAAAPPSAAPPHRGEGRREEGPADKTEGGAAYGDDRLHAAQLALRLGELEKRIAELEAKIGAAKRTQRASS